MSDYLPLSYLDFYDDFRHFLKISIDHNFYVNQCRELQVILSFGEFYDKSKNINFFVVRLILFEVWLFEKLTKTMIFDFLIISIDHNFSVFQSKNLRILELVENFIAN